MERVTKIDQLRKLRTRTPPSQLMAHAIRNQLARVKRVSDVESAIHDAWEKLAPLGIRESVVVGGCTRGTLTIKARGAPARYAADRWLRSGGMRALSAESGVRITRSRVTSA